MSNTSLSGLDRPLCLAYTEGVEENSEIPRSYFNYYNTLGDGLAILNK